MKSKEYYTIEPSTPELQRHGLIVTVYKHGEYPRGSVLEGYPSRQFIESYASLAEAQKAYPQAQVTDYSTRVDIILPHTAPSWFDESIAGERWDDDY